MHAFELTKDQVRMAKRDRTEHEALCGWQGHIGDRPTITPYAEAAQNHCPDCWRKLHPTHVGVWEPALVACTPFG
jgi:hypothetical protein